MEKTPEFEVALNAEQDTENHSFEMWDKCFSEARDGNFLPEISKNEQGEVLAPNGEVSKLPNEDLIKVTRTPTFKAWFGESRAIDATTKEPTLVYHGTIADVSGEEGLSEEHGKGIIKKLWFSSEKSVAFNYGENKNSAWSNDYHRAVVFSAFLKLQNPEIVDSVPGGINANLYVMYAQLKKFAGSEGIIIKDSGTYIVFDSKNVMHLPSDISQNIKVMNSRGQINQ